MVANLVGGYLVGVAIAFFANLPWLMAIRREGKNVSGWQFLKVGAVAMPAALGSALLGLLMQAAAVH